MAVYATVVMLLWCALSVCTAKVNKNVLLLAFVLVIHKVNNDNILKQILSEY